jgi:hypothetical protein
MFWIIGFGIIKVRINQVNVKGNIALYTQSLKSTKKIFGKILPCLRFRVNIPLFH